MLRAPTLVCAWLAAVNARAPLLAIGPSYRWSYRTCTCHSRWRALGYAESAIGPVAIGGLRDAFGSYQVGWLLVLCLALVLIAAAFGIPGRSPARPTPDQV